MIPLLPTECILASAADGTLSLPEGSVIRILLVVAGLLVLLGLLFIVRKVLVFVFNVILILIGVVLVIAAILMIKPDPLPMLEPMESAMPSMERDSEPAQAEDDDEGGDAHEPDESED